MLLSRCFAWGVIALMLVFLLNNYLTFWREWPGASAMFHGNAEPSLAWLQCGFYVMGAAAAVAFVLATSSRMLRPDASLIYSATQFLVRLCFWAVLFVGLTDMVISFMRVEGLLPAVFGDTLAIDLGRSEFRGMWVHFPMVGLAFIVAIYHRGLGFEWLALMVVTAELLIVFTRFIFSYEQAFMADLVRFWYAAMFLFSSAYTLLEEGHVRVDVLYSGFDVKTKSIVNAAGSVLLGIPLCAVILYFGLSNKSSIINGPLLIYETTQTGFGMYVKYWMAGFLGIFAISMMMQFAGYFLEGIADWRGDPGKRLPTAEGSLEG